MAQLATEPSNHPPVITLHVRDNAYRPGSFCNIIFSRSVLNVSGKPSGTRITSVNPDRLNVVSSSSSWSSPDSSDQNIIKIGDELVFINDTEIKPHHSAVDVMQILNDAAAAAQSSPASSPAPSSVRLVVIRNTDVSYRENVVLRRFQRNYDITWTSDSCVTLAPKNNPSKLQATMFPLWKTRFKYEVTFEDSTGKVSYKDLYTLTFARANGASPDQQLRIRQNWDLFEERLRNLEAQMEYDRDASREVALKLSQKDKV